MGYEVCGSGELKLKGAGVLSAEQIDAYLEETDSYFTYDIMDETVSLYFDAKWHSDNVYAFLDKLKEYVDEGCLSFRGEDGDVWQIRYDSENKTWGEFDGVVYYGDVLKTFSTADLLAELESRGINVKVDS